MNTENIKAISPTTSASGTLKSLANRYRKKLFFTFLLVVAENVTYLLYPILAGVSINAIMSGQTINAML